MTVEMIGWKFSLRSEKFHYYKEEDHRIVSLCGRAYTTSRKDLEYVEVWDDPNRECKLCRKALREQVSEGGV